MYILLLIVIYIAFISLGLPDSLIGSAWPLMHAELNVPLSYAGLITITIALGTVISSLLSDRLTKKMGTGLVVSVSVLLTALAMLGFSFATKFYVLIILAVPYGLGAGAIDAALNNYVAVNYKSKHMNFLHGFWGMGAIISPYIMSYTISAYSSWQKGYLIIAIIQCVLSVLMFISLPLYKKCDETNKEPKIVEDNKEKKPLGIIKTLKIKGVLMIVIAFFAYDALEQTTILWASSYLVLERAISTEKAAMFASFYFIGITSGRLLSGFVSDKIGDKNMIRIGSGVLVIGLILIAIPFTKDYFSLAGLIIAGLGSAPIYPAVIHSTPSNFSKENSQAVIGLEMASAYIGACAMPPLFGLIAEKVNIGLLPLYLGILCVLMIVTLEVLNHIILKNKKSKTLAV